MSNHTKEPWPALPSSVSDTDRVSIPAADFRRAVACVNACTGIRDEQLQKDTDVGGHEAIVASLQAHIAEVEQQRDKLLAALKDIVDRDLCYFSGFVLDGLIPVKAIQRARETILKVERNNSEFPNSSEARCIKPNCATDCEQCNCAIPVDDTVAVLIADLLEDVVAGDGGPYEDGEHPVVDRARAFLATRAKSK